MYCTITTNETNMCDFTLCERGPNISKDDDVVDVKTIWPKRKIHITDFLITWKKNGEAKFHKKCWDKVSAAALSRSKKGKRATRNSRGMYEPDSLNFKPQEITLIKEAKKTAEFTDSSSSIKHQAEKVSKLIQSSKFCVVFTGAGISTSAGIGDYRGKSGKWTEMDQNRIDVDKLFKDDVEPSPPKKSKKDQAESVEFSESDDDEGVPYESLRPTYTHEALYKLMSDGFLKYVISQNGDGLHGLSGIPSEKISELHGNVFLEICEKCGKEYYRPFYVMDDVCSQYFEELEDYGKTTIIKPKHAKKCDTCGLSHRTGRKCEEKGCKGYLKDSIINFGDMLEDKIFDRAVQSSEQCDLMLCLGTTLTVTPACDLVERIEKPQRIVICNRQVTEKDDMCYVKDKSGSSLGSRIFGDCDNFFRELMKEMYGANELEKWEKCRPERLKGYESQRNKT